MQTKMCGGRAVEVLSHGSDGARVRYLSSGEIAVVPEADLRDVSEPDAANRYNTGLTPGRVAQ